MTNEYLNYLYNYDAQASGLLGSFDASGKYIIEENIKNELLKSNKLITDFIEALITANSMVGAYKFDFRILIQEGEDNKKRAGLFLIEKASLGFYEDEIQTLIHYIVLPNDGAFIDSVKKTFNLYTRDESEGIDMSNAMLQAILKRKSELDAKQKNSIGILYDLDNEYVRKMLAILKGYGLIGNRLIIDFKNIVKSKNLNKLDKSYWKELKVILDKLLIANATVFDSNIMAQIELLQKNYLSSYKEAKIPLVIENTKPKKAPKKSASKPIKISDPAIKIDPIPVFKFGSKNNNTNSNRERGRNAKIVEGRSDKSSDLKVKVVERNTHKSTGEQRIMRRQWGHTGQKMNNTREIKKEEQVIEVNR